MQKSTIDPNSNEYLLAKIGVDTDENEPVEDWWKKSEKLLNSIHYSFASLVNLLIIPDQSAARANEQLKGDYAAKTLALRTRCAPYRFPKWKT